MKKLILVAILLPILSAFVDSSKIESTSINTNVDSIATVTKTFSLFGNWPLTDGDCEMDTGDNDVVIAECSIDLDKSDYEIYANISFYCSEYGGDNTTFNGTERILVYKGTRKIKKIIGVTACNLSGRTKGQNHEFNSFQTGGCGFVNSAKFRIDSKGDDCKIVGASGNIEFSIELY